MWLRDEQLFGLRKKKQNNEMGFFLLSDHQKRRGRGHSLLFYLLSLFILLFYPFSISYGLSFGNFGSMMDRLHNLGDRVGNRLNQQTQKAIDKVNTGFQKAGQAIHQGVTKVGEGINKGTKTVIGAVHQGVGTVAQGLNKVGLKPLGNVVNKVNDKTYQGMQTLNKGALQGFQTLNKTTYTGLSKVNDALHKGAQVTADGLHTAAQATSHGLVSAIKFVPKAATTAVNKVKNITEDAIDTTKNVVHKVGDFTKDTAHTVGGFVKDKSIDAGMFVKDQAINIYEGSRVMGHMVEDVKSIYENSKGTIEAWRDGDFVGGIRNSAKVFQSVADIGTFGSVREGEAFGRNLAKSFKHLIKGEFGKAGLAVEAMALNGATIGLGIVGGPINMFLAPKSVEDMNQSMVGMAMGAKDFGVAVGHGASNFFGHGQMNMEDAQNFLNAGARFQEGVTDAVATTITNVDLGRSMIKDTLGDLNKGTQSLGNTLVAIPQSIKTFSEGNYVDALRMGGNAALDATEGIGKVGSASMGLIQRGASFVPIGGTAVAVGVGILGGGLNMAANIKTIGGGFVNSGNNFRQAINQWSSGNVGEGFKNMGISMGQAGLATALAGTQGLSGGLSALGGSALGSALGKLGSRGMGALDKLASRALEKGSNTLSKVLDKSGKVVNKIGQISGKIAPKIITVGTSATKFGSGQTLKYQQGRSVIQKVQKNPAWGLAQSTPLYQNTIGAVQDTRFVQALQNNDLYRGAQAFLSPENSSIKFGNPSRGKFGRLYHSGKNIAGFISSKTGQGGEGGGPLNSFSSSPLYQQAQQTFMNNSFVHSVEHNPWLQKGVQWVTPTTPQTMTSSQLYAPN